MKEEFKRFPPEIPVDEHTKATMDSITRIAAVVGEIDFPALKRAATVVNALVEEASKQPGTPMIAKLNPANPSEALSWIWLSGVKIGQATADDEDQGDEGELDDLNDE